MFISCRLFLHGSHWKSLQVHRSLFLGVKFNQPHNFNHLGHCPPCPPWPPHSHLPTRHGSISCKICIPRVVLGMEDHPPEAMGNSCEPIRVLHTFHAPFASWRNNEHMTSMAWMVSFMAWTWKAYWRIDLDPKWTSNQKGLPCFTPRSDASSLFARQLCDSETS